MNTEKVTFEGWKNCLSITNGDFRIVAATEFGPRIIGAFFQDSSNLFYVDPETKGKTGGGEWHIYGGHRLWHSPEAKPRSYTLENSPVEVTETKKGLILSIGADERAGIAKSMEILPAEKNSFRIVHRLKNGTPWPVECAAWALSVMAPGGTSILPMPQLQKTDDRLLPNTFVALWGYNTLCDGRCTIGSQYTVFRNDPKAVNPLKIGYNCEDGWIGYQNMGVTFIKRFEHLKGASYPDNGCSVEVYSCAKFQEMETLSPLFTLAPGEEIEHAETWTALKLGSPAVTCEADAKRIFG